MLALRLPTAFVPVASPKVPPLAPMMICCTSFGVRIADAPSLKETLNGPPAQVEPPFSHAIAGATASAAIVEIARILLETAATLSAKLIAALAPPPSLIVYV